VFLFSDSDVTLTTAPIKCLKDLKLLSENPSLKDYWLRQ